MTATDFWNRVNFLIRTQNKTQSGLSLECGLNQRRIQNLSASSRIPDVFEGVKIARALGVSVEYLVTGKETDGKKQFIEDLKNFIDAHS